MTKITDQIQKRLDDAEKKIAALEANFAFLESCINMSISLTRAEPLGPNSVFVDRASRVRGAAPTAEEREEIAVNWAKSTSGGW